MLNFIVLTLIKIFFQILNFVLVPFPLLFTYKTVVIYLTPWIEMSSQTRQEFSGANWQWRAAPPRNYRLLKLFMREVHESHSTVITLVHLFACISSSSSNVIAIYMFSSLLNMLAHLNSAHSFILKTFPFSMWTIAVFLKALIGWRGHIPKEPLFLRKNLCSKILECDF